MDAVSHSYDPYFNQYRSFLVLSLANVDFRVGFFLVNAFLNMNMSLREVKLYRRYSLLRKGVLGSSFSLSVMLHYKSLEEF